MSKIDNAMEQFYQYVKYDHALNDELSDVLVNDEVEKEFFDLCKKFADISLNAPKFRDEKSGEIAGCFQFSDIEKAKNAARDFYFKYQLNDIYGYMETIHKVYHLAVEWDDERRKSGLVQFDKNSFGYGFMGRYYNFQELPEDMWLKICNETKEYIQSKSDNIDC